MVKICYKTWVAKTHENSSRDFDEASLNTATKRVGTDVLNDMIKILKQRKNNLTWKNEINNSGINYGGGMFGGFPRRIIESWYIDKFVTTEEVL
jgi:hypothetical protein